jgi:hypothetical protein
MCLSILKDFIFPIAAFAISVIALIFSIRTNIANRRPHLIFSEEQFIENGHTKTGFYLRNIGLGPAFNINIPEKYVHDNAFLKSFTEIPRNLASNNHTLFSVVEGNKRFINEDLALLVIYEDHQGRLYQTSIHRMRHSFKRLRKRV